MDAEKTFCKFSRLRRHPYQAVEELFLRSSSHLAEFDDGQLADSRANRLPRYGDRSRPMVMWQVEIGSESLRRGKFYQTLSLKDKQKQPADDSFRITIGLQPSPLLAESARQSTSSILGMVGNHLPDKGNVRFGDGTVTVSECLGHAWLSNRFLASSHAFF